MEVRGVRVSENFLFYRVRFDKFSSVPLLLQLSSCNCKPVKLGKRCRLTSLSMDSPPDGYRRNVGICLVDSSNKLVLDFVENFCSFKDSYARHRQMPQGGADEGEDLSNAAIRELREETGVTSAEFLAETPCWLIYDYPLKIKGRLNCWWGTNYKGQAQKWFLLKFTGKEEEINLLGDGSEKPEFKECSWMLPEQILEVAVDFKKPVYEQVLKLFSPYFLTDSDAGH